MPHQESTTSAHGGSHLSHEGILDEDMIDMREVATRLRQGSAKTLGLALLGLVIAAIVFLSINGSMPATTSGRVTFSFKGFDRGLYPDNSKFQADDLRAPDVVAESLKHLGVENSESVQSEIRGAISVEGIISPEVIKQRDKVRATGQIPPPYYPDEYLLTLSLRPTFPIAASQPERLLNEIVNEYRNKFTRTYAALPPAFGNAFEVLRDADYLEYELILNEDIDNIIKYLTPQLEANPSFRSSVTNLSFADLIKETRTFAQIHMFETLGQVQINGASRDRRVAMVKMDYHLRTLDDRERRALSEEEVVQGLLGKTQERAQSYVLGIKSQATQSRVDSPVLDQGLIDSLLANDSYNFLVHKALDAGLQVKRVQSEKAELVSRRAAIQDFLRGQTVDQSATIVQIDNSLKELEAYYKTLVMHIRKTLEDYNRQQFADAIRVSANVRTEGIIRKLLMFGAIGFFIGAAAGMGLSLLGVQIGSKRVAA